MSGGNFLGIGFKEKVMTLKVSIFYLITYNENIYRPIRNSGPKRCTIPSKRKNTQRYSKLSNLIQSPEGWRFTRENGVHRYGVDNDCIGKPGIGRGDELRIGWI